MEFSLNKGIALEWVQDIIVLNEHQLFGLGNVLRPKKRICTLDIGVYGSPHIRGIFLIIFFVLIILLMQSELELSAE